MTAALQQYVYKRLGLDAKGANELIGRRVTFLRGILHEGSQMPEDQMGTGALHVWSTFDRILIAHFRNHSSMKDVARLMEVCEAVVSAFDENLEEATKQSKVLIPVLSEMENLIRLCQPSDKFKSSNEFAQALRGFVDKFNSDQVAAFMYYLLALSGAANVEISAFERVCLTKLLVRAPQVDGVNMQLRYKIIGTMLNDILQDLQNDTGFEDVQQNVNDGREFIGPPV